MEQTQRQQMTEALVQAALLEAKEISVSLAEIIAYLQRREHLAALGTLQGIDQKFEFLGAVLKVAGRLPR